MHFKMMDKLELELKKTFESYTNIDWSIIDKIKNIKHGGKQIILLICKINNGRVYSNIKGHTDDGRIHGVINMLRNALKWAKARGLPMYNTTIYVFI